MADRNATMKIIQDYKKHGDVVLEALDQVISLGPEKGMNWRDLDLRAALEADLGPDYRSRIERNDDDSALEAVITSGIFHKMVQRMIRFGLTQNPKEENMLLRMTPVESIGECDEGYIDWGVFDDFEVHEVSELQMGPLYGISTDYLKHPNGKAYANALAWTREALCKDPNGFIQRRVPALVQAHQDKQEERLVDVLIGYNTTWNRSGVVYDIYYDDGSGSYFEDGSSGPWINSLQADFVCPADFEPLKAVWRDFTDMVHGRPENFRETGLDVFTSLETASALRKLLQSTQVEEDVACGSSTMKYVMTPQVANDLDFSPVGYRRMVSKIMERYSVTEAEAQKWIWFGHVSDFMALVYNVRPEARRVTLSSEDQRRRIVALYDTYSKWYVYVKNPKAGTLVTHVEESS